MVEVFKTGVLEAEESVSLILLLLDKFPKYTINFDLEDCDKILRIEGNHINNDKIITLLNEQGYACETLY